MNIYTYKSIAIIVAWLRGGITDQWMYATKTNFEISIFGTLINWILFRATYYGLTNPYLLHMISRLKQFLPHPFW